MNVEKTLKDLYDCDYIVSDEELYPLQKWYNRLLNKTITEIDVCDVPGGYAAPWHNLFNLHAFRP